MAEAPHGFAGRVVEAIEGIDELGVMEDHELVQVMLLKRLAHRLVSAEISPGEAAGFGERVG